MAAEERQAMSKQQEHTAVREFLIEQVKTYPAIWDTSHKEHKSSHVRGNCWLAIQKELQGAFPTDCLDRQSVHTIKGMKDMWQNLLSTRRKHKKKTAGKSGAAASDVVHPQDVKWPFYAQLEFLDSAIKVTNTVNSLVFTLAPDDPLGEEDAGENEARTNVSDSHKLRTLIYAYANSTISYIVLDNGPGFPACFCSRLQRFG